MIARKISAGNHDIATFTCPRFFFYLSLLRNLFVERIPWWIAASWCHSTRLSSVCLFVSLPNKMRKPLTFLDNLVHQFMMEEELTRVHPHCLAIHTKDKRQKPLKRIRICELLSFDFRFVVMYDASRLSRLPKAKEVFAKVSKFI